MKIVEYETVLMWATIEVHFDDNIDPMSEDALRKVCSYVEQNEFASETVGPPDEMPFEIRSIKYLYPRK